MQKLGVACLTAVTAMCLLAQSGWGAEASDTGITILNTKSFWRFRTVRETPEVVDPSGKILYGTVSSDIRGTDAHGWYRAHRDQPSLPADKWRVRPLPKEKVLTLPADTPSDWMKPEFNDDAWFRSPGPMLANPMSRDEGWKLILMRGTFNVKDPAMAGELKLYMEFRGGVVVYLNGEEVSRVFMPKGPLSLATPAGPYPPSADFTADKYALPWDSTTTRRSRSKLPKDIRDRVASRTRRVSGAVLSSKKLRKGVNVLAVAIHRAPTPAARYVTVSKGGNSVRSSKWWRRLGLNSIRLTSVPGSAVVPNVGPVKKQGFRRWNHNVVQKVSTSDYPDPFNSPNPIMISATRNGSFSGQVIVGDEENIVGLKATVSDLKGPGIIPSSAVLVRYAMADGTKGTFDALEEVAPEAVLLFKKHARSIQPIWFTVRVPATAKPGDYTGTVTISAEDVSPVKAELKVHVSNWVLPPSHKYAACMDIVQSPETVAMAYDVPLWSDEHFKLLDKTFALLGALGNKTVYITCIRRTHFGNEHAMVRWTRDDGGELQPDFTIAEKYLDTAMKHMGKIPGVVLYCWEPPQSQGHAGGTGGASRTHDRPIIFSLYDPETKKYSGARGPAWGTPEAREFWKKLSDGMQVVLEKRGLKKSMLFGLIGDHRPTKQAMDDVSNGVPDAKWAVHSHLRCENWKGYDMGMFIALWGIRCSATDPSQGHSFGWSNPRWMSYYPREMSLNSTLTEYRCKVETWIGARNSRDPFLATRTGPRGLGRLGGDFWPVLGRGRRKHTLAGRYPESAWGQLNLNFGVPRILAKGEDGPLATVRSEAFREAIQEMEARVYLEKAWLDPEAGKILGPELVKRCRMLLDERIRIVNASAYGGDSEAWFISSGWRERSENLFELAAEVSAKYGSKQPNPDLDRKGGKK